MHGAFTTAVPFKSAIRGTVFVRQALHTSHCDDFHSHLYLWGIRQFQLGKLLAEVPVTLTETTYQHQPATHRERKLEVYFFIRHAAKMKGVHVSVLYVIEILLYEKHVYDIPITVRWKLTIPSSIDTYIVLAQQ